jgi:hypothetical protein
MRRPLVLIVALLPGISAWAQPPGLPGTSTPQPYERPEVRSIEPAQRDRPPLLVNPRPPREPSSAPQVPQDRPLPPLESERRSQQRHPAESIDKP